MNINVAALVLTGIMVIAGVSTASALSHLACAASGRLKTQRSSDILEDITSFPFIYRNSNNEKQGKNRKVSNQPVPYLFD